MEGDPRLDSLPCRSGILRTFVRLRDKTSASAWRISHWNSEGIGGLVRSIREGRVRAPHVFG